jgi:hypothetical protein
MEEILNKLEVGINMKMAIRRYCQLANITDDIIEETIEKLKQMKLYEIQKLNSELKSKPREEQEIRPMTDNIKR